MESRKRRSTGEGRGTVPAVMTGRCLKGRAGVGAEVGRGAGRALFIQVIVGKSHSGSVELIALNTPNKNVVPA